MIRSRVQLDEQGGGAGGRSGGPGQGVLGEQIRDGPFPGEKTRDEHTPAGRMTSRRAAGELEAEVLAALWAADGPLTTADVRHAVGGGLAYNTVQTILVRLYDKGLIDRLADGRRHEYFPVKGAEELAAEQMQALLSRGRDRQAVLQRFATSLSVEDARLLRAMLRRRR